MNIKRLSILSGAVLFAMLSINAQALDVDYAGEVTVSTDALGTLVPAGTVVGGPITYDDAAVAGGLAGPGDITSIDVSVGGFCFTTNDPDTSGCPVQPGSAVPITSIDAAAVTFSGGKPTGGTLTVTAFSPTFMVSIPISFDLTAGTFLADAGALGTTSGTFGLPPGVFIYKGSVTAADGALATLVPAGTPVAGPFIIDDAAVAIRSAGVADITSIDVNVGGFCFSTGPDGTSCPLQPSSYVPITSIDAAALTFAGGAPTGGTLSVTAFSPTFMVSIPIDFDLTGGTFSAVTDTLGSVSGVGELTIPVDSDSDGVLDNFDNCTEVANPLQQDSNGDGIGNICDADIASAADLLGDCFVNFSDLNQMKAVFFSPNADADLDSSGFVNFTDLDILKAAFFRPPGPSANGCTPGT